MTTDTHPPSLLGELHALVVGLAVLQHGRLGVVVELHHAARLGQLHPLAAGHVQLLHVPVVRSLDTLDEGVRQHLLQHVLALGVDAHVVHLVEGVLKEVRVEQDELVRGV